MLRSLDSPSWSVLGHGDSQPPSCILAVGGPAGIHGRSLRLRIDAGDPRRRRAVAEFRIRQRCILQSACVTLVLLSSLDCIAPIMERMHELGEVRELIRP
jgi:hypothetical protein